MEVKFKKFEPKYLDEVWNIELESFGNENAWTKDAFMAAKEDAFIVAVDEEDHVMGYIHAMVVIDEMNICSVAVSKKYRNNKIGSMLLYHIENYDDNVKNIYLEVRVSNIPAIVLYEKNGYNKMGIRKNFYSFPREDAFVYKKEIGSDY